MFQKSYRLAAASLLVLATGCGGGRGGVEGDPVPLPLPASQGSPSEGYRIAKGDLLDVVVFDAPELSRPVRVTDQGEISLPLLGTTAAAGLTTGELEARLADGLRGRYMVDPQVTVAVTEVRSDPIYVTGEVNKPGAFPLEAGRGVTVLQAVSLSEGLAPMAAKSRAMIIRTDAAGARLRIPVNLGEVLAGTSPDMPLQPNDIVFVPRSTGRSVLSGVFGALLRVVTFRGVF